MESSLVGPLVGPSTQAGAHTDNATASASGAVALAGVGGGLVASAGVGGGPGEEAPSTWPGVEMGRCKWECGPRMPVDPHLFRTNATAAWECRPCYNGHRALKGAARSDEDKQALRDMALQDPEGFRAKVRACAIRGTNNPTYQQQRDRGALCVRQVTIIRQIVTVMATAGVKYVDEAGYIRRYQTPSRSAEDLSKEFALRANDPSVDRLSDGVGGWLVPVPKYPRVEVAHGRSFSRQVESIDRTITTEQEAGEALEDVARVGMGASALAGDVFGGMGQALRPAGMAGALAAPSLGDVVRDTPTAGALGPLQRFGEAVRAPEGELVTQGRRRAAGKRRALANSHGTVLAKRKEGLEIADRVKNDYAKASTSVVGQIGRMTRGKAGGPTEGMKPLMAEFKGLVKEVLDASKDIGKWLVGDCEAGVTAMREKATRLVEVHIELDRLLDEWKLVHASRKDVSLQEKQKEAREKSRRSQAYVATTPKRVLNWLDGKDF